MNTEQFIKEYRPGLSEYCPVVITEDGNIYECQTGHLDMLKEISGDEDILSKIPADESPLLFLAELLRCVIVDYENQVYVGELSKPQKNALEKLAEKGLISRNPVRMTEKSVKI